MQGRRKVSAAFLVAAVTVLTFIGTASPALAAKWFLYSVYGNSASCQAAGEALVDTGYAQRYKCEWDSPGFGLYLYK